MCAVTRVVSEYGATLLAVAASLIWPVVLSMPAKSSFRVQFGDLPTWLLAVLALGALVAAVVAYLEQRKAGRHLAEQVRLQGDALAGQREATIALADQAKAQRKALEIQQEAARAQGKVLEAELRELNQRAAAVERQQAEAVVFAPKQAIAPDDTSGEVNGKLAHMAVVRNGSQRPIRNVTCRLSPLPGRGYECVAAKVVELATLPVSDVMQLPFSSQPQSTDELRRWPGGRG